MKVLPHFRPLPLLAVARAAPLLWVVVSQAAFAMTEGAFSVRTRNGLEWTGSDSGEPLTWYDAIAYCENLTLGGQSDWRLPDLAELDRLSGLVADQPRVPTPCSARFVLWCQEVGCTPEKQSRGESVAWGNGTFSCSEQYCGGLSRRLPGIETTCHHFWTRSNPQANPVNHARRAPSAASVSLASDHGQHIHYRDRLALNYALCLRQVSPSNSGDDPVPAPPDPPERRPPSLAELFSAEDADVKRVRDMALGLAGSLDFSTLSQELHASVQWPPRSLRGVREYHWSDTDCAHPAIGQEDDLRLGHLPPGCRGELPLNMRRLTVRLPAEYDPGRPWPLLMLVKGNDAAQSAIDAAERQLGAAIEDWVVAAPGPELNGQQRRRLLQALRRTFHLDASRTVALSWGSPGGFLTWNWVLYHGDDLAAAIVIDESFPPPLVGPLWAELASGGVSVPVLTVWGSDDKATPPGPSGKFGSVRRRNRELERRIGAEPWFSLWKWIEVPGRGAQAPKPVDPDLLSSWLATHRGPSPDEFVRHLVPPRDRTHSAWWLAPLSVSESGWDPRTQRTVPRRGESLDDAFLREFLAGTPHFAGRRSLTPHGVERIEVETHLIEGLAVHFECDRLTNPRSVVLEVDGEVVFRGEVAPSVPLALLEARRTLDFERLTCAILARTGRGEPWRLVSP